MQNCEKMIQGKCLVVVNPNAGSRKGEKDWPVIEKLLYKHDFAFEAIFTQSRNHAINLTASKIDEGFRKIIVVGGDGTLNEVVNGVFAQNSCKASDILLAMIPVGTGNDWGRMYKLPGKYEEAIQVIEKNYCFIQDIGKVIYHDETGSHQRFFANVSGMGYDALVARKTNRMKDKGKGSPFSYLLNIFTGLFQYKYTSYSIAVDEEEVLNGRVLSMNIGICKYNGGGLKQVPNAISDDGLLDITVIKATSRLNIFRHVAKLYDGSFIKLSFVETYRGKTCRIVSDPIGTIFMEADGESLGHSPLEFTVLPKSLSFIIPEPVEDK